MSDEYVGFRMPVDMRAAVESLAAGMGMTMSEFIRHLIHAAITGQVPEVPEGYIQARAIAHKLAFEALREALGNMPQTYEEALEMLSRPGPGRPGPDETEAPDY